MPEANAVHDCVQKSPMPDERPSLTHQFKIGDFTGLMNVGFYKDGRIGEIQLRSEKEGSSVNGLLRALSISVSVGLQHGIPVSEYLNKFKHMTFEPGGTSSDPDVKFASSILDYAAKWIERRCLGVPPLSVVR